MAINSSPQPQNSEQESSDSQPEEESPQFQVVNKLKSIPLVDHAYGASTGVYNRVKNSHYLLNWACQSAEGVVSAAVGAAAPLTNTFQEPISEVDAKLCQGLDLLEEKVPLVKEQPEEIYKKTKDYVSSNVNELQGASLRLADRSWSKANELLNSHYGYMILSGFDTTSSVADKYIDYFLPPVEGENNNFQFHPNSECQDKVLHTLHTVGNLCSKMSTRVSRRLSRRVSQPRQG